MSVRKFLHQVRVHFPLKTMQKIFFGALIFLGFLTGIFIANVIITFSDLKDIRQLENYSTYSVPTKVWDQKGKLITEFYVEKREIISYKDLPPNLIKAIVSIEDNEFFRHRGFNFLALVRGVIIDPLTGRRARGGSTLTQQLAKSLYTTGERSIFRKLIELWYAFQIEKKYSKEEILELYFNQVFFGHGCYGVQAASRYFFDKDVKDLSLAEASLLAGLVQLPSAYSPLFHPYRAQKRHYTVLSSMARLGYITQAQADEAFEDFWNNYSSSFKAKGINAQRNDANPAPFFTEYVRIQLIEKYGEEQIYQGGLNIYTTLDVDKQVIANREMQSGISNQQKSFDSETRVISARLKDNYEDIIDLLSLTFGIDSLKVGSTKLKRKLDEEFKNHEDILYLSSFIFGLDSLNRKLTMSRYQISDIVKKKRDQVQGALISINPTNGYIEAMVGGSEFSSANQYNRAVQAKRQMGSLFKPIYYGVAIEKRLITPASVYEDLPKAIPINGQFYEPRNYEGTFRGNLRIRQALQYSVNVVSVQVWGKMMESPGYNAVMDSMAGFFGLSTEDIKKRVQPSPAFALGVGTFSPLEVARAFAVFANDGVAVKPVAILRVTDRNGNPIDDFKGQREFDRDNKTQVMDPGAAFIMQSMLNTVLYSGTGAGAAKSVGFNLTAGGKTGTTPNWTDAWFAGFTKNLSTVVWVGFDDPSRSLGRHRSAASVAAPIWMAYMKQALKNAPDRPFTPPANVVQVEVCADSGMRPGEFCPHVVSEYFLSTMVPNAVCNIHTTKDSGNEDDELNAFTNNDYLENIESELLEESKPDQSGSDPEGSLDLGSGL